MSAPIPQEIPFKDIEIFSVRAWYIEMYLHQLRIDHVDDEFIYTCTCPRLCERIIEVLSQAQDDSGLLEVCFQLSIFPGNEYSWREKDYGTWTQMKI